MDSHTTGPGFKTWSVRYFLLSFRLTTTIPESVERSLLWVEGRGTISRSGLTQDIKMGSCAFHINGQHSDRSTPCMYTVTGWSAMSCVCSMTFLCGSTLVKVPLLQASTVVIWPQMFKSDVKPKQTNIYQRAKISRSRNEWNIKYTIVIETIKLCSYLFVVLAFLDPRTGARNQISHMPLTTHGASFVYNIINKRGTMGSKGHMGNLITSACDPR